MSGSPVRPPSRPAAGLAQLTPARVALGRSGVSLPTAASLAFGLAHARARDAIHTPLSIAALCAALAEDGWSTVQVQSCAQDRSAYLARPDWGRRLDEASRTALSRIGGPRCDLALMVGDGLSSAAVQAHARPLLAALRPRLASWRLAPAVVIASQARVALGDDIGQCLGARMVVVLIGERPGLSAPDSLGLYLTAGPRIGRSDAERNCISNVHRAGLAYAEAARQCADLIDAGLRLGLTGVALARALGAVSAADPQ